MYLTSCLKSRSADVRLLCVRKSYKIELYLVNPFSLCHLLLSFADIGSCVLKSPNILKGAELANLSMRVCRASMVSTYCNNLFLSPSKNGKYVQQMTCIRLSFMSYSPTATILSDAVDIYFIE